MAISQSAAQNDFAQALTNVPEGIWLAGKQEISTDTFDIINPGNGKILRTVYSADAAIAQKALDSAAVAAPDWAATPARARAEILRNAFDLIVERKEELALIMTLELGRTLAESRTEVNYGAEFFRWFSEEASRIEGRILSAPSGTGTIMVVHQPVGIALAITPWNFPLAMGTRKIGPALAAGCPIIVKPAQDTPLSSLWLAKILQEAGLPDGVLSVLPTDTPAVLTSALLTDPRLRKISFTGSTSVGKHLLRAASEHIVHASMELGGNAPVIIFDDADIDEAVEGTLAAKMRNGGQACTAANRIFVHKNIKQEFTHKFTKRVSALTVGPGWENYDIGAVVNHKELQRIVDLVINAQSTGAKVLTGGMILPGDGVFYQPTVLSDVTSDMYIAQEEIFGPVAILLEFDDEDTVIAQANGTPYGLASYIFTRNIDRAFRVSRALHYGMVGINRGVISDPAAPFGGYKESGLGREGGKEGIFEYLETKYLAWN